MFASEAYIKCLLKVSHYIASVIPVYKRLALTCHVLEIDTKHLCFATISVKPFPDSSVVIVNFLNETKGGIGLVSKKWLCCRADLLTTLWKTLLLNSYFYVIGFKELSTFSVCHWFCLFQLEARQWWLKAPFSYIFQWSLIGIGYIWLETCYAGHPLGATHGLS